MDIKRTEELQNAWENKLKQNPNLKCTHPHKLEKEYWGGTHTGDYICPICGEAFTFEEKKQIGK